MSLSSALWPLRSGWPPLVCEAADGGAAWEPALLRAGVPRRNDVAPLPRPSGRRMGLSMADLIYGQVHLYPSRVELGLLAGTETRDVILWNAAFTPLDLMAVSSRSPAGTTLSGIAPGSIPPTGTAAGRLTVLASGPARQETVYTFLTSLGERKLEITALRVLLFPFWPEWSAGLETGYAFDTVVARDENGGEQRRPLARRPLRTLRATVWGDGVRGQRLHHLVHQGKDRVFGVPLWQEARRVAAVGPERDALTLDGPFEDCWNLSRLCGLIMIHERRRDAYVAASLAAKDPAGGTLLLSAPLDERFASGDLRVVPLFSGMLTRAEPRTVSDGFETWSVAFEELGASQPDLEGLPHAPADPSVPWLWPHRPDWSGEGPGGVASLSRIVRAVRGGVTEIGARQAVAPAAHRQSYLLRGDGIARLLDGVTALRGRWGRVRVRDPRRAFTLTRGSLPNQAMLYARDNGAREGFVPGQRLWLKVGASILGRALLGVEAGEEGEIVLHLDAELGMAVPPSTFVGREYLARLDTDRIDLRHETAGVARCDLSFCTLPEEVS